MNRRGNYFDGDGGGKPYNSYSQTNAQSPSRLIYSRGRRLDALAVRDLGTQSSRAYYLI